MSVLNRRANVFSPNRRGRLNSERLNYLYNNTIYTHCATTQYNNWCPDGILNGFNRIISPLLLLLLFGESFIVVSHEGNENACTQVILYSSTGGARTEREEWLKTRRRFLFTPTGRTTDDGNATCRWRWGKPLARTAAAAASTTPSA